MKELFQDILEIEHVRGLLWIDLNGTPLFSTVSLDHMTIDWPSLVGALESTTEIEAVFEQLKMYVLRTDCGYIIVLMAPDALVAMIRLHCSIIVPELTHRAEKAKGLGRWFKKK